MLPAQVTYLLEFLLEKQSGLEVALQACILRCFQAYAGQEGGLLGLRCLGLDLGLRFARSREVRSAVAAQSTIDGATTCCAPRIDLDTYLCRAIGFMRLALGKLLRCKVDERVTLCTQVPA